MLRLRLLAGHVDGGFVGASMPVRLEDYTDAGERRRVSLGACCVEVLPAS